MWVALAGERVGGHELLEWAPKSYWSGLQRAIGVGSKELKGKVSGHGIRSSGSVTDAVRNMAVNNRNDGLCHDIELGVSSELDRNRYSVYTVLVFHKIATCDVY